MEQDQVKMLGQLAGGVTVKWMQKGQVKMLGQLVGWVQVNEAGSSEDVRSIGGVRLLLSGCRRIR